jgi:hypothetical protein
MPVDFVVELVYCLSSFVTDEIPTLLEHIYGARTYIWLKCKKREGRKKNKKEKCEREE